jgi:osmotically-inducible protein OsmY
MRTPLIKIAALAACALASGCMSAGFGDRSLGRGFDDAAAASQVRMRLMAADGNGFGDVDVVVANGVMLLTGAAPTQGHKDAAELIARTAGGVSALYNEIVIGPGATFTQEAEDEVLAARIRARLATSTSSARSYNVEIETYRGAVYLLGAAHTETEVRRAAEIASVVPGVTRVVSLMDVRDPRPAYARNAPATPDYRGQAEPALDGGARY